MPRHRFDPLSAALGVLAIGAAVFVISGRLPGADGGVAGWSIALGAIVLGLGLIPWSRGERSPSRPENGEDGEFSAEPRTESA